MSIDNEILSWRAVGARLEEIRAALDVSDNTMAAWCGVSPQKWNNWKKGRNALPYYYAAKLCAATGVTTDMIYRDVRNAISKDLSDKLLELHAAPKAKVTTRPKGRGLDGARWPASGQE